MRTGRLIVKDETTLSIAELADASPALHIEQMMPLSTGPGLRPASGVVDLAAVDWSSAPGAEAPTRDLPHLVESAARSDMLMSDNDGKPLPPRANKVAPVKPAADHRPNDGHATDVPEPYYPSPILTGDRPPGCPPFMRCVNAPAAQQARTRSRQPGRPEC